MAFSPIGGILAVAGEDSVLRFWDLRSGREIRRLAFPQGAPCPFLFTPDGEALIGGGRGANPIIHMWDANTGKELRHWDLTRVLNGQQP